MAGSCSAADTATFSQNIAIFQTVLNNSSKLKPFLQVWGNFGDSEKPVSVWSYCPQQSAAAAASAAPPSQTIRSRPDLVIWTPQTGRNSWPDGGVSAYVKSTAMALKIIRHEPVFNLGFTWQNSKTQVKITFHLGVFWVVSGSES